MLVELIYFTIRRTYIRRLYINFCYIEVSDPALMTHNGLNMVRPAGGNTGQTEHWKSSYVFVSTHVSL